MGGYFCFPNIFIALLALFHIGYYVPVRLGLVDGLDYMPPGGQPNRRCGHDSLLLRASFFFHWSVIWNFLGAQKGCV